MNKHFNLTASLLLLINVFSFGQVKPDLSANLNWITPTNVIIAPQPYPANSLLNYVRTWEMQVPTTNSNAVNENTIPAYVKMVTMYSDGFGKKVQTIVRNHGDLSDLIRIYDNRDLTASPDYLPFSVPQGSRFQYSPFLQQKSYYDQRFPEEGSMSYSLTKYSSNPVSRTVGNYEPGKSLVGLNLGRTTVNGLNTADEVHLIKVNEGTSLPERTGYYSAGKLLKKVTTKENGGQVTEYYENNDRLICKRVSLDYQYVNGQLTATNNSTYYVYDEFDRLRFTISPKAATQLKNSNWTGVNATVQSLCDFLVYDSLDRIVEKHTAGKIGNDYLVYDSKNRVVMAQSPKQRELNKWAFTLYDGQDRPKMTGILDDSRSRHYWQHLMNGEGLAINNNPGQFEYYAAYHNDLSGYPVNISGATINSYTYYDTYSDPYFSGHQFDNSLYNGNLLLHLTAVTPQQSVHTRGFVTGTKVRVIKPSAAGFSNMGDWIYTINYYDDFGHIIQSEILNQLSGAGWDRIAYQYSFKGNKLREIYKHYNPSCAAKPTTTYVKSFSYHPRNFKLQSISLSIDNSANRSIVSYGYDDLGRVSTKTVGGIESQSLKYNIRNQLIGINADYALNGTGNGNCTYGEVLKYDYGFTAPRYDGNIAGMIWRGAGSSPMKAYGYQYSLDGKLSSGDYTQFNSQTNSWGITDADYSEKNITYDENGNIKTLSRMGRTTALNGYPSPALIDDLTFSYKDNNKSDRLQNVNDQVTQNNLTDFDLKDVVNASDFEYDAEGNCITDNNRKINTTYSYLNRPEKIEFGNGDKIYYAYDASGNKLAEYYELSTQKYRLDYAGAFVYRNDSLQQIIHEEGNARFINPGFAYQYYVKDHEGNTRNVLEAVESPYPREYFADHEVASAYLEQMVFDHIPEVRTDKPGSSGSEDEKSAELDGAIPEKRVGTSLLLHVMSGDKFRLSAQSYYDKDVNDAPTVDPGDMTGSIISTLVGGRGGLGGSEGGESASLIEHLFNPSNFLDAYESLKQNTTDPTLPRAYLNYVVFNDDMQIVPDQSGAIQVGSALGEWQTIGTDQEVEVSRNGYLAIYISNESQGLKVNFDKISISYYKSSLVDENHYYPYGLTINLSTANPLPNRYLFLGNKLEKINNLNIYDFNARQYDPQIGRFLAVDPVKEYFSGYAYSAGDPVSISDKTGLKGSGSVWTSYGQGAGSAASNMMWNSVGSFGGGGFALDKDFMRAGRKAGADMLSHVTVWGMSAALGGLSPGEAAFVAAESRAAAAASESAFARGAAEVGLSRSAGYVASSASSARGIAQAELRPVMGGMAMESSGVEVASTRGPAIAKIQPVEFSSKSYGLALESPNPRAQSNLINASETKAVTNLAQQGTVLNGRPSVPSTRYDHYSVAFEMQLPTTKYPGGSYYQHFKAANEALDLAMKSDPNFAASMTNLGISIPKSHTGNIVGKSPTNWVWHHDKNPGILQLVPKYQHPSIPGGPFWNVMHPNGVGGGSLWNK